MPIRESSEAEVLRMTAAEGACAVFVFTPLCGTCALAERMLDIALAAGVRVPLVKTNINFAPKLRDAWQIASVPCLALLRDGRPVRLAYAMRSVQDVHAMLKELE